ncbi:CGGC domain-containing protein [Acidaminobacter sp. JC074]|uniref:CGGC domain-containing protein n=1 Tax=Acidaminobacter sp. JC074 TaxID=2530199 RepID=UPI001F0FD835|nr:CGGC domain-containing protein [Acidaminobacter sp. JC074]MCH4886552.1 CGGC domain-containing protein [Acidaminobacter sp. JC074]
MKIGVLVCNKMTYDCTGIGCFKAFEDRRDAFSIYQDAKLLAFFHCNGCNKPLFEGMDYKFEQLKRSGVDTLHMARCIEVECHRYDEIKLTLEDKGFQVVKGSHS